MDRWKDGLQIEISEAGPGEAIPGLVSQHQSNRQGDTPSHSHGHTAILGDSSPPKTSSFRGSTPYPEIVTQHQFNLLRPSSLVLPTLHRTSALPLEHTAHTCGTFVTPSEALPVRCTRFEPSYTFAVSVIPMSPSSWPTILILANNTHGSLPAHCRASMPTSLVGLSVCLLLVELSVCLLPRRAFRMPTSS